MPDSIRERVRRLRDIRNQCGEPERDDIGRVLCFLCQKQLRAPEIDLLLILELRLCRARAE